MELSSAIDIPVTVNMIWTGPNGFMTTQTVKGIVETTNFSATTMIFSFGKTQSGNYTCTASINSTALFLKTSQSVATTLMVTTGKDQYILYSL